MSTLLTSSAELVPAVMPGPRIISGARLEGSWGRYLPWRILCSLLK
jgi:hypothetical protein